MSPDNWKTSLMDLSEGPWDLQFKALTSGNNARGQSEKNIWVFTTMPMEYLPVANKLNSEKAPL